MGGFEGGAVAVRPERLFGRHLAILGATGGGKSWTVARILEQSLGHRAKIILLDATGEYRSLQSEYIKQVRLGEALHDDEMAEECALPADCFIESDFIALFEPSGKVQGPKLRDAIQTLRIVREEPGLANDEGHFVKANKNKVHFLKILKRLAEQDRLEDPRTPFDVTKLSHQLLEECVWPTGGTREAPDVKSWGSYAEGDKGYCLPLAARIVSVIHTEAFAPVFRSSAESLIAVLERYLESEQERLLRISLSGVSYEYRAREVMANVIGRTLLVKARLGDLRNRPLLVIVDEAHNFIGQDLGRHETATRLDAFELIAREGRKYGLNLCLATQRPRDLTQAVLSQMGTLIVHRLTNDRDRDVVERACGEIDHSASAFLPNLKPGEAAVIGVDFPIPLTIQIEPPKIQPLSKGPDYQAAWRFQDENGRL